MPRLARVLVGQLTAVVLGLTAASLAHGSSWTLRSAYVTGMESTGLAAVSCTEAAACTAVGTYYYEGHRRPLVERWNGAEWALQTAPLPAGARSGGLEGVSCTSDSFCVAVGWQISSSGEQETLAEQWSNNEWTVTTTPTLTKVKYPQLSSVSCSSANACTAVGFDNNEAYTEAFAIAERWNGTTWTSQAPEGTELAGVSCPSESDCIAVGETEAGGTRTALAEQWTGGEHWSPQTAANPNHSGDALESISCTATNACTAVGDAGGGLPGDREGPLAERWNGSVWANQSLPTLPPDPKYQIQIGSLDSVSCTSASACYAVGARPTGEEWFQLSTLAEEWDGAKEEWTIQPTSDPGEYQDILKGVSCTSLTACAAVGSSTNSVDAPQFLKPLTYPGLPSVVPVAPPSAITTEAEKLFPPIGIELNGIVRDAGHAASWYFEYGETSSYGSSTPAQTIGGEPEAQYVDTHVMSGVYHGHTYHFRLVLIEEGVTHYGEDKTFEGAEDLYPPISTSSQISTPNQGSSPPSGSGGTSLPTKESGAGKSKGTSKGKPSCKVPKLISLSLAQARRHASSAHCAIRAQRGMQSRHSKTVVLSQSPRAGHTLPNGGHIELRLGVQKPKRAAANKHH